MLGEIKKKKSIESKEVSKKEVTNFPIVEKKYDNGSKILTVGEESGSRVRGKLSEDGKIFKISSTFVAENERGRGVATKMYIQLLEDLKSRGVERVQSDNQVEEVAGKIYSKLEKEGYVINKHKDAILEIEDVGNFWWIQSDDSKSPFEIDLSVDRSN